MKLCKVLSIKYFFISFILLFNYTYSQDVSADTVLNEMLVLIKDGTDEERYNKLEDFLKVVDETHEFYALPHAAKLAYRTNHFAVAKENAERLLRLMNKYPKDWNYGNAIHDGNMILGRIALKNNKIDEAKEFLIKAGKTPGSPQINSFGPNVSLANDFIAKKEYAVVIEYLELCRKFWRLGNEKINKWIDDINNRKTPYFGGNLYY